MKKTDLALILSVLAIAGFFYALYYFTRAGGTRVDIFIGGELYNSVALNGQSAEFLIDTGCGFNAVSIFSDENGNGVAVSDADCPGRDCVRAGKITKRGQTIICLPHRLLVRIEADAGEGEVDAVAR